MVSKRPVTLQGSRDAVDAAETSARLDAMADEIDTNVTYSHAFALVVLDEVNALRSNAGLVVLQRNGPRTMLHELWKHDLPDVGPSGADGVTGGYQSFHVGGGKWKVKRLPFKKPSGQVQPERTYPDTFNSEFDAQNFIRMTLVGTR